MRKPILTAIALLCCLALFGAKHLGFLAPLGPSVVGKQLRRIELFDLARKNRSFDELEGNETVIYFFTSWCGPCFKTLGLLQEIEENYELDKKLLAVALDSDVEGVMQMVEKSGFRGDVWIAKTGTMALLQRLFGNERRGVPYVVALDRLTIVKERTYEISGMEAWKSVLVDGEPLHEAKAIRRDQPISD